MTEPHRAELLTHCYRLLGSLQDAEDIVQETFLRAWRRLETYQGRASYRAWLYKIATNTCLDALRQRPKRSLPPRRGPASDPHAVMLPPTKEPIWLEPFPEELLAPAEASAEARYEARESITLAFLTALHLLPPRQRAVLILRDVLTWQAREVAGCLDTSVSAVNSLLHRARSALNRQYSRYEQPVYQSIRLDKRTKNLLERYVHAWETADIDGLVALLKEDATFPMPPSPSWYQGRKSIADFLATTILAGQANGRWRLLPVRANSQPAFAFYRKDETGEVHRAFAIQVLTLDGDLFSDVTTFGFPALFKYFELPDVLTKS